MQLGLAHRALQPRQQPVVENSGRVDPVSVGDQRAGQRAQIQQPTPIRATAREPGDLKREDHADMAETDLGCELAKPDPGVRPPAGLAGVLIHRQHRSRRPAELHRALGQRVPPCRGLGLALDLPRR
jgi:hypothetical protein